MIPKVSIHSTSSKTGKLRSILGSKLGPEINNLLDQSLRNDSSQSYLTLCCHGTERNIQLTYSTSLSQTKHTLQNVKQTDDISADNTETYKSHEIQHEDLTTTEQNSLHNKCETAYEYIKRISSLQYKEKLFFIILYLFISFTLNQSVHVELVCMLSVVLPLFRVYFKRPAPADTEVWHDEGRRYPRPRVVLYYLLQPSYREASYYYKFILSNISGVKNNLVFLIREKQKPKGKTKM